MSARDPLGAHEDLALPAGDDPAEPSGVFHARYTLEPDRTRIFDFLCVCAAMRARRATDVEGPQRQLRPGSPIDCAARIPTASPDVDQFHGRQVAAVAHLADAAARLDR